MSQANLTMKDMFEVQKRKGRNASDGRGDAAGIGAFTGRGCVETGGREEIEADPVERSAGCFIREDGRGSGHSGADVPVAGVEEKADREFGSIQLPPYIKVQH